MSGLRDCAQAIRKSGFECSTSKIAGVGAALTGLCMVALAIILAAGTQGAGQMYFMAAFSAAGSILPFALAAHLFCDHEGEANG